MIAALRRYLIAGLLVWVPLGVTLLLVTWMVEIVDRTLLWLPQPWRPEQVIGFGVPGLGLVLTAAVVIGTGIAMIHLFGFHLVDFGERIVARIPVVGAVYSAVKQVTQTMYSNSGQSFRQVVLVRYPHKDAWTLGFSTGDSHAEARQRIGRDLVNVFVPTTPNPTSGFFLLVPREEIVALDMPVEEGLKMLLSLGVVQAKDTNPAAPSRGV
jgi:uncharacterized membrane protein